VGKHDATFVFYEGEEVADEHNGLRRLFAERADLVQGDLAVLLEPTGGWVEAGCQGTIHVRATEYSVGSGGQSAMPAQLPPNSGYTYALELSSDEALTVGAKTVQFSTPLPLYVDNFLNFPIGTTVPTGVYDRQQAAWIPSRNGKVIQVLSTTGGSAQIDSNGDGVADDAATLRRLALLDDRAVLLQIAHGADPNLIFGAPRSCVRRLQVDRLG